MLAQVQGNESAIHRTCHFLLSPIPLGADGKSDIARLAAEKLTGRYAIRVQGRNAFEPVRRRTEGLARQGDGKHFRQDQVTALLGRLDRDLLPFAALFFGILAAKLHHTALRRDRTDRRSPEFRRFLHQPVETLIFDQGDDEMNSRLHTHLVPFAQNAEANALFRHLGQLDLRRSARAVENHRTITARHAQHLRGMPCLGFRKIR